MPVGSISVGAYEMQVSNRADNQTRKFFENTTSFNISATAGDYSSTYVDENSVTQAVTPASIITEAGLYVDTSTTYFIISEFSEGRYQTLNVLASGEDFQEVIIPTNTLLLEETRDNFGLEVYVGGVPFTYTSSFLLGKPSDKTFRLMLRGDGTYAIQFGDSNVAQLPNSNEIITIRYRIGGGDDVVLAESITSIVSLSTTAQAQIASIINLRNNFGGTTGDSISDIKTKAPIYGSQLYSLDSITKVNRYCESLSGVGRAKVYLIGTKINIAIIPVGGGVPSEDLLADVEAAVLKRLPFGYSLSVVVPSYVSTTLTVVLYTDGYSSALVQQEGVSILTNLIDPLAVNEDGSFVNDIGTTIKISTIGTALKNIDPIFKVYDYVITTPGSDISLTSNSVINAATSTISVSVVGGS